MTVNELLNKILGKQLLIIYVYNPNTNISDYYDLDEIVELYECLIDEWQLDMNNNHLQIDLKEI